MKLLVLSITIASVLSFSFFLRNSPLVAENSEKTNKSEFSSSPEKSEGDLRIMTFNIRYDASSDKGERDWKKRLPRIVDMIRLYQPDIIGFQELLSGQRSDLKKKLKDYGEFGEPRNGYYFLGFFPSGEFNSIFYRKKRLELLNGGTFWLNENLEPYKKGWGAALPRISTWGEFFDRDSQKHFWFFNTHLSHSSEEARIKGMSLIMDMAEKKKDFPEDLVFIAGDFNDFSRQVIATAQSKDYRDAKLFSDQSEGPYGTYTGWGANPKSRIDFILTNQPVSISRHVTLDHFDKADYPLSDHLPVFIDVR